MKDNRLFYSTLPEVTEDMFRPRPEAVQYLEREKGEKALLDYIEKNFHFEEGDISEATASNLLDIDIPVDADSNLNEISST